MRCPGRSLHTECHPKSWKRRQVEGHSNRPHDVCSVARLLRSKTNAAGHIRPYAMNAMSKPSTPLPTKGGNLAVHVTKYQRLPKPAIPPERDKLAVESN